MNLFRVHLKHVYYVWAGNKERAGAKNIAQEAVSDADQDIIVVESEGSEAHTFGWGDNCLLYKTCDSSPDLTLGDARLALSIIPNAAPATTQARAAEPTFTAPSAGQADPSTLDALTAIDKLTAIFGRPTKPGSSEYKETPLEWVERIRKGDDKTRIQLSSLQHEITELNRELEKHRRATRPADFEKAAQELRKAGELIQRKGDCSEREMVRLARAIEALRTKPENAVQKDNALGMADSIVGFFAIRPLSVRPEALDLVRKNVSALLRGQA